MSENKIHYIPSPHKRFDVSHDSISRDRLRGIATIAKELRIEYPFVVGATLFGSLSKGKVLTPEIADESDIDLVFFIDPDEIKKYSEQFASKRDPRIWSRVTDLSKILSAIFDRGEDERDLENVGLYLEKVVNNKLNQRFEAWGSLDEGIVFNAISFSGEYSIHQNFKKVMWGCDLISFLEQDLPHLSAGDLGQYSRVVMPWLLDLGGGLAKYRKAYFTEMLGEDPSERDLEWRVINYLIEYYERGGIIPEKIKRSYPKTFTEALKYYGVRG